MHFVQISLSFFGNGAVMRRSRDEVKALLSADHYVVVITPRPACLIDFIKDQSRWFTAFFQLHQSEKKLFFITFILCNLSVIFPLY